MFQKFIISPKGSVSVYLVIVLLPIFVFNALLIDYIRVKVAEADVETTVKTGLRSELAEFDTKLQNYGLFGLINREDQLKNDYTQILQQNVIPTYAGNHLALLDEQLNLHSVTLKTVYTLANQTVFRQQILENMKYAAPLEYSVELVNKFKNSGVNDELNQSSQFATNAKNLETMYIKRNQSLDNTWRDTIHYLELAQFYNERYAKDITHIQSLTKQIGISKLENSQIYELSELIQSSKVDISVDYLNLSNALSQVYADLDHSQTLNTQLKEEKQKLLTESTTATGLAQSQSALAVNSIYEHILVYDMNYFSEYRTNSGKVLAVFSGMKTRLDRMVLITTELYEQWMQDSQNMNQQIVLFKAEQGELETNRQKQNMNITQMQQQQLNSLNQWITNAQNIVQGCDANSQVYTKLTGNSSDRNSGFYQKYISYNSDTIKDGPDEQIYGIKNENQVKEQAMSWIQKFTDQMSGMRDDLYVDEFALNHFTFRTSVNQQSVQDLRPLRNQEVEYILYGHRTCQENYAAAYGEMYVVFLALRTMEALKNPQYAMLNVGSPLLILLAASVVGAKNAFADMNRLLKGDEVVIIKSMPKATIDYKQLLRIFLLLHHNDEKMLSRMQALIELNTGDDLEKTATYIEGSASVSVGFWFVPELMKTLKVLPCQMSGIRCNITKMAVMSY